MFNGRVPLSRQRFLMYTVRGQHGLLISSEILTLTLPNDLIFLMTVGRNGIRLHRLPT